MNVRIGINPIVWSNDDFRDLGGDIPLEQCLREACEAGYEGIELGHKFPREASALRGVLDAHGLRLVSGWHSAYLLERGFEEEKARFVEHVELLAACGCDVVIVAECSARGDGPLSAAAWDRLCVGMDALAELAGERGLRLAYHHHVGTVVQTADEVAQLMRQTHEVALLLDTGHLALAGADPVAVLRAHGTRVAHVHLKDVRRAVVERVRANGTSFEAAVRAGVFTVPGDGSLDFAAVVEHLRQLKYRGWLVVEAEQDPATAPPSDMARKGREHLRNILGR